MRHGATQGNEDPGQKEADKKAGRKVHDGAMRATVPYGPVAAAAAGQLHRG